MIEPQLEASDPYFGYEDLVADMLGDFEHRRASRRHGDLGALAEDAFLSQEDRLDHLAAATWKDRARLEAAAASSNLQPLRAVDSAIGLLWGLQSALAAQRVDGAGTPPDAIRYAAFSCSARALSAGHELQALLRAGLGNGARARWRTLYELAVLTSVLAQGNRGTASRYINHRWVRLQKSPLHFIATDDESGRRRVNSEANKFIRRYGKPYRGDYGWAAELTRRRLNVADPRFHHLEELAGLDGYAARKNIAHQLVHPSSLGIVYSLTPEGDFLSGSDHWEIWQECFVTVRIIGDITLALARLWTGPSRSAKAMRAIDWCMSDANALLQHDCFTTRVDTDT